MNSTVENFKIRIKTFIDLLNYDLSEYEHLYAHMEHMLDLDKEIQTNLFDKLLSIKLSFQQNKLNRFRSSMYKSIRNEIKKGSFRTFYKELYDYDYTIFDLRDIDAESRYNLKRMINGVGTENNRLSLLTIYRYLITNITELIKLSTEIYTYLENYKEVKEKNFLTYEDIMNLTY